MPLLRWPSEVLGTAAGNDQFSGATSTVYFGRMGDDVFFAQPGVPPPGADPGDPLFIGGSGNDTYVLANSSEVIVAEYGSSASDVLVATGMGINRTTTFVFTIDNRHLAAADTQTGQSVFVLDWQVAANRIETIVLADGTFSFAQIQSAVFGSPNFLGNFTWEFLDIGYSTADVNEAIGFYTARGALIDSKRPPVVTPTSANSSLIHDQSAAASTLFSVSDPDGDPITVYNFFDTGAGGGAFTVGGAPQAANQIITVPAANLSTMAYRAGTFQGAETVHVRAYDGVDWSAWVNWTMTSFNSVPVVTPAASTLVTTGQAVALSSLFSFADADGDALNSMNLYDAGAGGGFLRINGVTQPALTLITITAAQFAQTEYVGGVTPTALPVSELLWSSASDGTNNLSPWANLTMSSRRGSNVNPVVNAPGRNIDQNQWRQLSELVTVTDADGDPVQQYEITDSAGGAGSAYFYANGVIQAQGATALVSGADLVNTWVNGGGNLGANGFSIRASDGYTAGVFGGASTLTLTTRLPNHAPVVSAPNSALQVGQAAGVGSLVGFSDADGDALWSYEFYDAGAGGGRFQIGAAAQPALTIIPVSAAQLASTQYVAGASPGSETLWVHGYDGQAWSGWTSWQMFSQPAGANALPVVNAPNRNIDQNQWRQLSELITVSDAEGNPINQYQITDSTAGASSASFYANGVIQAQGATALVNAADLANTWVNGGANLGANGFAISAFDTFGWSGPTSLNLNTRAQPNRAPVFTGTDQTVATSQAVMPAALWTVTDLDGDAPFSFELYDAGAGGGQFQIGAAAQPGLTIIPVSAAQLASTQYVAGASAGSETLWARVYDGQAWSNWDSWVITAA